jgi:hypothetical protein
MPGQQWPAKSGGGQWWGGSVWCQGALRRRGGLIWGGLAREGAHRRVLSTAADLGRGGLVMGAGLVVVVADEVVGKRCGPRAKLMAATTGPKGSRHWWSLAGKEEGVVGFALRQF